MSVSIIADSSALISLISNTDHNHALAVQVIEQLLGAKGTIVVPGDVFSETLNVVGKKIGHDVALQTGQEILASKVYAVLEAGDKTRQAAFELFKKQPGSVSFTDCIVMTFADRFNTRIIFGFDAVFKKNGYKRLGFDD